MSSWVYDSVSIVGAIVVMVTLGVFIGGDAIRGHVIKECQDKQTVTLKGYKIYCSTRVIDIGE